MRNIRISIQARATTGEVVVERASPRQAALRMRDTFEYLDEREISSLIDALTEVRAAIRSES